MSARLVTGYVPTPVRHRSHDEYQALGRRLGEIRVPTSLFLDRLESCWMWRLLRDEYPEATAVPNGDPAKNTLEYLAIQHQKVSWMSQAAKENPSVDTFVWMDYGILHIPDLTEQHITEFFARVRDNDLAIPGCWEQRPMALEEDVSWRFCGGLLVCPRTLLTTLDAAIREEAELHIQQTGHVEWEVNTWARVEQRQVLPIRWYAANHDLTMVTHY